jgi:transcriptional regulator with XRE-family HTH domain
MVGLKQAELAVRAGMSKTALLNIENGASTPKASTLAAIKEALESAGIVFLEETDEVGAGIRLRESHRAENLTGESC